MPALVLAVELWRGAVDGMSTTDVLSFRDVRKSMEGQLGMGTESEVGILSPGAQLRSTPPELQGPGGKQAVPANTL